MKKTTIWLPASFWFAILLAFNACSSDGNEDTSLPSSSEAQASSSNSEIETLSSSSEVQVSSSSSEVQVISSSSEAQASSSSSEIQISSSSAEAEISSSSSEIETSSSSSETETSSSSSEKSSSSEVTSGTFTDTRDYREYKWIKIGEQTWMAENLNYSANFSPSDDPPCYNSNTNNCDTYGRLYGPTAKTACPTGWHLPTKAEWQTLVDFVGSNAGQKLKATSGWSSGNGTDEYGFAALPGGSLNGSTGEFQNNIGTNGYWWSSDEEDYERGYPWSIGTGNDVSQILNPQFFQRYYSIRCLKN